MAWGRRTSGGGRSCRMRGARARELLQGLIDLRDLAEFAELS